MPFKELLLFKTLDEVKMGEFEKKRKMIDGGV